MKKSESNRIAKIIAHAGITSRREAENWIKKGRVSVNGKQIYSPAINLYEKDKIYIDNKLIKTKKVIRVYLFNKPRGLICTHSDPQNRTTIYDSFPKKIINKEVGTLHTVGRLDINSEGLIIITNSPKLKYFFENPANKIIRTYKVKVHGITEQSNLDNLKKGINIYGKKYDSIKAKIIKKMKTNMWLKINLTEGKNREIRNVLSFLNLEVIRLKRISYGPFSLTNIPKGNIIEVKKNISHFLK